MSLKGVGRSPGRRSVKRSGLWQAAGMVPQGTGLGRSPDARTRQIRIRNRQQHLHTAMLVRWQAKRRAAFQDGGRAGAEVPDRTDFRCDAAKATVNAANSAGHHRPSTSPLVRTPVASAGVPLLPSHGETPPDRSSLGGAGPRAVPASIALAQAEQKHAAKPANIDCNGVPMLVRSSLLALDHANKTGNYTVLRDIGAPDFRSIPQRGWPRSLPSCATTSSTR
jgi:hypothetical protein